MGLLSGIYFCVIASAAYGSVASQSVATAANSARTIITTTNGQLGANVDYAGQTQAILTAVTAAADPLDAPAVAAITPTIVELERRRTDVKNALFNEVRQIITWAVGLPIGLRRRWQNSIRIIGNNLVGGGQGRIDAAEAALGQSLTTLRALNVVGTTKAQIDPVVADVRTKAATVVTIVQASRANLNNWLATLI